MRFSQIKDAQVAYASRPDALAIAGRVTGAAHRASGSHAFAMSQHSFFGAKADHSQSRWFVCLLFLILIFIPHEAMPPWTKK
jgi:hypothetical protein